MQRETYEPGHRVELMRLREKVTGIRKTYRVFAVLAAIGAPVVLLTGEEPNWGAGLALAFVSGAMFLAYRDCFERPRRWAVVAALVWTACILGEFATEFRPGTTDFFGENGAWELLVHLGLSISMWGSIPSREAAELIAEHREEWQAYSGGDTLSSHRNKVARATSTQAD